MLTRTCFGMSFIFDHAGSVLKTFASVVVSVTALAVNTAGVFFLFTLLNPYKPVL